jgi:hypothetical protein
LIKKISGFNPIGFKKCRTILKEEDKRALHVWNTCQNIRKACIIWAVHEHSFELWSCCFFYFIGIVMGSSFLYGSMCCRRRFVVTPSSILLSFLFLFPFVFPCLVFYDRLCYYNSLQASMFSYFPILVSLLLVFWKIKNLNNISHNQLPTLYQDSSLIS